MPVNERFLKSVNDQTLGVGIYYTLHPVDYFSGIHASCMRSNSYNSGN